MREGQAIGIGVLVKGAVIFAIAAIAVIIFMSSGSSPFNDFAQEKWDTNSCLDLKTSCNIQKAQQRGCDWAQGSREEAQNQCPEGVSPANDVSESGSGDSNPLSSEEGDIVGMTMGGHNSEGSLEPSFEIESKSDSEIHMQIAKQADDSWSQVAHNTCSSGETCSLNPTVDVSGSEVIIGHFISSEQEIVESDGTLNGDVITNRALTGWEWTDEKWEGRRVER